ncbi:MAG: hypothetical protein HFJ22_07680 [Clostridia bacterium]|nr:hypothetical protein [Clostridia bacterium]MCI9517656.1 hypothetical protein [Clostridia bacterium]
MKITLEKTIKQNANGLFLLDSPTGFGKTTTVVELIRRFLRGDDVFSKVKRIFFVTNLITNLPYSDLREQLTEEEKELCFQAKATNEYVIEKFLTANITNAEVKNSKEYKNLKEEIEAYESLKALIENQGNNNAKLRNSLKIAEQKISADTEPTFRRYIKAKFFFNKSIADRNKFIKENGWLTYLYPIINIDKYKVIFLTTKKFISPIDTFRRMPFYLYNDELVKDSLVFIDEFDATKGTVLDQIVEDGLKNEIDILALFLDLHFALQNLQIPQKLLSTSEYHKKKQETDGWHTTDWHFAHWKEKFKKLYEQHNLQYLLKSFNFQYDRAFLFDDGKYFNVFKDNSKEKICVNLNKKENVLSLNGVNYSGGEKQVRYLIQDLEFCIDGFTRALFYVYNNYWYSKNEKKGSRETKYTQEEAIYTVLDVLNLSNEQKDYLFNKIQKYDFSFEKPETDEKIRRGFNYIEIEDSEYHDAKSIVHNFNFPTTPEDIIIRLAEQALIIGISATAKVDTCIGNYDLKYLTNKLGAKFLPIKVEDESRIHSDFEALINRSKGKYNIHTNIIDEYKCFSDRERCIEIINDLFIEEFKDKYLELLSSNKVDTYYFLLELKLAKIYKNICENDIKSFIAFVNGFPKSDGKFNLDRLNSLFDDICAQNKFNSIVVEIIRAKEFDIKFNKVKDDLSCGKQVFIITTYQTIGSGKNIQYSISDYDKDRVFFDETDTKGMKDFEGVYIATPTNLVQRLALNSENKYNDLAKFLFHQEYLYKNKLLTYPHMKSNIINGFKQTFFTETGVFYFRNNDIFPNTLKLAIQAIGRICRCRNKNKDIYIYADCELIERVQFACAGKIPKLLNNEFRTLLELKVQNSVIPEKVIQYSTQSKEAFASIRKAAFTVRNSSEAVYEWQQLRDFVLKNPTTNNPGRYEDLYFKFDDEYSGYTYQQDSNYNITNLKTDIRAWGKQVSDLEADLPILMHFDAVKALFERNKYALRFNKAKYIMSPSLFQQVYLGALGEVVGKEIIETQSGWDLEDISNVSLYELFDYQAGKFYFDFKHWDMFIKDNDEYVKKVERKLKRVNGEKAIVVNLLKRNGALSKINIDETVIQIPYLLDPDTGEINDEAIDFISENCY